MTPNQKQLTKKASQIIDSTNSTFQNLINMTESLINAHMSSLHNFSKNWYEFWSETHTNSDPEICRENIFKFSDQTFEDTLNLYKHSCQVLANVQIKAIDEFIA